MTISRYFFSIILLGSLGLSSQFFGQNSQGSRFDVEIVSDEADAVIEILEKRSENLKITETDWSRLFSTEGYTRIKKRRQSFNLSFEDSDFKKFLLSEELLLRRVSLLNTLSSWKKADLKAAGSSAFAYLPKGSGIRAKIYPVIKPRKNSYVYEIKTNPGIFLYLDPEVSKEKFENTLAHELHHIGFGTVCPPKEKSEALTKLPENSRKVLRWMGAFGEGFAMLAAAGGPEKDPHEFSSKADRDRWNNDITNFNSDLTRVESFFLQLSKGELNREKEIEFARSFYGIQGPWYTVGWKMSVVIEKMYGREKLIDCMCDKQKLLRTYNDAAEKYSESPGEKLAVWSEDLLKNLS